MRTEMTPRRTPAGPSEAMVEAALTVKTETGAVEMPGAVILTNEEFDEFERLLENPPGPTESIRQGADLLRKLAAQKAALAVDHGGGEPWRPVKELPTEIDARIVALVESEMTLDERIPALLIRGWRRCGEYDRIVGWKPAPPATADRPAGAGERE